MISLDDAKKIALGHIFDNGLEISEVNELPDKWVFGFRNAKTREEPDIPPVYVTKKDGQVGDFFPPDHIDELEHMKLIEGENT